MKKIYCSIVILVAFACGTADVPKYVDNTPYFNESDYPTRILNIDHLKDTVIVEDDVAVIARDGTRLSARVFRPNTSGQYPVVMSFTAYDKTRGPDRYPSVLIHALKPDFDLGTFTVSEWATWEGPDPAYWVPRGYAVVYVDTRGYFASRGKASILSEQDRDDFHDAIEWAGTRDWSNGNVGLNGVSYLAISQWVAASGKPPHLKAIVPWEGQTDAMREVLYHGGIPETAFTSFWIEGLKIGARNNPAPPTFVFNFVHKRPRLLRFVQKPPSFVLADIEVPALICATWSDQGLHSRGSFEGYKRISSEHKWVYTHGRPKWSTYYSEEALAFQTKFFDHFLKGADNGMRDVPSVRLEIRDTLDTYSVRYENEWPIARTEYRELYLDGRTKTLELEQPKAVAEVGYDSRTERATFNIRFDRDTELSGYMKLKLWVATSAGADMDLFVGVQKLDARGAEVAFYGKTGYNRGPAAMGWLRVSERELDTVRSTPYQPVLTHARSQPIAPGEIVPVEIEILPSSTLFKQGETLRLVVQGRDLFPHPSLGHTYAVNEGTHTIHSGGQYDSHLLVPVIPR